MAHESAQSAELIVNGLQLKKTSRSPPFRAFDYTPAINYSADLRPTEWHLLSACDIVDDHIRVHELREGDNLLDCAKKYQESHAQALIVINTTNESILSPEMSQSLYNLKNFLVAILPQHESLALRDILDHNHEIWARLDVIGSEDVIPFSVHCCKDNDTEDCSETENKIINAVPVVSSAAKKDFRGLKTRFHIDSFNLVAEMNKVMFDVKTNNILPICTDKNLFAKVMANFSKYEKMEKHEHSQVNELIGKLKPYLRPSLYCEFPFFLILAYRLGKFTKWYQCTELNPFIIICIDVFEKLDSSQVAESLNSFLEKNDFSVMFGQNGQNESVFALLANSCLYLMSFSMKIVHGNTISGRLLYCKFLWISVHLKCIKGKKSGSREISVWDENIVKMGEEILINEEIIEGLRLGLGISKTLELPPEYQFTMHQLACFLANDKFIRPLSHVRNVIMGVEEFIKTDNELFAVLMVNLRCYYTLAESDFAQHASVSKTALESLNEGICFIDSMVELRKKKEWNKQKHDETFRAECFRWIVLMFSTINLTDQIAPELLGKFLFPNKGSILSDRRFREDVVRMILEKVEENFQKLTVYLFFPLFKKDRIWPQLFIQKYLSQYHTHHPIKICDGTWSTFFNAILDRFQNDEMQNSILSFLTNAAELYGKDKMADSFIVDILQLEVPSLFSSHDNSLSRINDAGKNFSNIVRGHMQRYCVGAEIIWRAQEIIGYIPDDEKTEIPVQKIVLSVLQLEIIPNLMSLKSDINQSAKQFKDLLNYLVDIICQEMSQFVCFSPKQKFCWGVISALCNKVLPTDELFEESDYLQHIIMVLGRVFQTYCSSSKLHPDCLITDKMPQEVQDCTNNDVQSYFNWVQAIQKFLCLWKGKFSNNDVSYDEIQMCKNSSVSKNLGSAVCATICVLHEEDICRLEQRFEYLVERLNCYLLRYIPDHPELKYCTLLEVLLSYGVTFPPMVQEVFEQKIIFPGDEKMVPGEQKVINIVSPSDKKIFNPGQNIYLKVTRSFLLKELEKLLEDIQEYLEPVFDHIDMLVFFYLHKSEMFRRHLLKSLDNIMTASSNKPEKTYFNLPSITSITSALDFKQSKEDGISLEVFKRALDKVNILLVHLLEGTATYSDIVANGAVQLDTLNIEEEFTILTRFSEMKKLNCQGLDGVKCILDLFRFIHHIDHIRQVCEQYGLEQCLKDKQMQDMFSIAENLQHEESRAKITPVDAQKKMAFIKKVLCLEHCHKYDCLNVFPAVANSAPFYQFIKDRAFKGSKGRAVFDEQYQLITAHLQHEEYDERVLNHLRVAYEFIAPFMEADISFSDLMEKVFELDVIHGLKQLETVNENITLIRLWFSRTEGDTVENVAWELQHIIENGRYQFQLKEDPSLLLIYRTMKSIELLKKNNTKQPSHSDETSKPHSDGDKKDVLIEQRWTSEQIADFVRKLGFLDVKKEGGDLIKHFLHLNSTANKLLKVFVKLYELGNSHYKKYGNPPILDCNTPEDRADAMVEKSQKKLNMWQNQVASLRQKYTWLLFFSVPKALKIHSLLEDHLSPELDSIVLEVSFLFENRKDVRIMLEDIVRYAVEEIQRFTGEPMEITGKFLQLVCESEKLKPFLCKERSTTSSSQLATQQPFTSMKVTGALFGTYQLHYAPGYSQSQILCLITDIYKGVPECFEVFHCRSSTKEEELYLFMERIKHHPLTYLVLLVNMLPFNLQEILITLLKQGETVDSLKDGVSVHFIETSPSVLREVPWITCQEYSDNGPKMAVDLCKKLVVHSTDFYCIQLVYGHAGDGKTYYIRQKLNDSPASLTVTVNEAFTPLYVINRLNKLPLNTVKCAVFFNFTLMPYQEIHDETERGKTKELIETIGWFFYHFLILGYVEDPITGASFRFPGGQEWAIYIEIPSLDRNHEPEESLQIFAEIFPTLGILGSPHLITGYPLTVDEDVQLVCKYLKAYKIGGVKGINRLYTKDRKVQFSNDPDLSDEDCHELLKEFMPDHIQETKISQKLFIRYMLRRCAFLENFPAFCYNSGKGDCYFDETLQKEVTTDTHKLGSTLMQTMLEEVSNFCDTEIKKNWAEKPHHQLIYDFSDGGGAIGFLSLQCEKMPEARLDEYEKLGIKINSPWELQNREILDHMLARALGLPLEDTEAGKRLSIIDDCNYVLTLDYTVKMLTIHERNTCGMPVIIKGETGVGKTALMEMLSQLWNQALLHFWNKEKKIIINVIRDLINVRKEDSLENYQSYEKTVEEITVGKDVSVDDLMALGLLNDTDPSRRPFHFHLRELVQNMEKTPAIALLQVPLEKMGQDPLPLAKTFELAKEDTSNKMTATLLKNVFKSKMLNTFHKLNVHAALLPCDIKSFFEPVFEQAKLLEKAYISTDKDRNTKIKLPFITVFLDEINTSSCLGLFKEIIVDKTLEGEPIPENVFIVAACNPHHGNSMTTHATETWLRSSYYVRPLHPTLEYLMWDFGSLDEEQEQDYIRTKMKMLNKELSNLDVTSLAKLILTSQCLMRKYASMQLQDQGMNSEQAKLLSKSCVSQRDIQRVFTFYQWWMSIYNKLDRHPNDRSRHAVMVSLGIVYYMRLNNKYREKYKGMLNKEVGLQGEVLFSDAFDKEIDFLCEKIDIPPGIAKTKALKENIFATIVCTVTHIPLVIVGAPGSSKTLSFNITIANLKGPESKMPMFRDVTIFKSLDPHFYQCSRRTTSNEVQTVFSRAINRQRIHAKVSLPIYCVVFMDEAGLPEESHESLKVLHYHLDKQEVSFVAITNHVLDAAKTNRAVSLFRPEASKKDLKTLAKGCLTPDPDNPPAHLKQDLETIVKFCPVYSKLMEDQKLRHFFGLRDFIHFINYLRKRRCEKGITVQLVTEALERNFNGIYWSNEQATFQATCQSFLNDMYPSMKDKPVSVKWRSILEVLKESLGDHPKGNRDENEVRYKLVIDPTEDNSLMHLLIAFGVLDRQTTRIYVCSDFPGDSQIQKINTIAAIRHSAIEGHTVVMSQTDDIHESFYDLFNQRFRKIDDPEHGPRYYANIAIGAHSRPCRVHPDFTCVVVVKQSEVDSTPAPFLNRFEKYYISHEMLLSTALSHLQPCVRIILQTAREKVNEFINIVGRDNSSIYGLKHETLDSLLLSILPPYGHTYKETIPGEPISDDVRVCLLHELLRALRRSAGFAIPAFPFEELVMDADHLFPLVLDNNPTFEGAFKSLTSETANAAINEAMHVLHTASSPNDNSVRLREMSQEACLVVSILQQWLIRHFCKNLMQLMTPEAICLHRRKIPSSLIDNYLTNQQHFSLKKLIEHHLLALESRQNCTYICSNKLLCFTRSSSIIHHLPTIYPYPVAIKISDTEDTTILKELVYNPAHLRVCQILSVQSQTAIQETLMDFIQEPKQKILLLIVNMQEATIELVNHLRVMIGEAETQAPPDSDKLFVVLLHFPPTMFFDQCYPSLFLRGWNHYYLDSIGHSPTLHSGKLDIEEWFQRCCFLNKDFEGDNLIEACSHLLKEVVPTLVSHITYGTRSKGPFTRMMKAAERSKKLKEILFDKGIGKKLCQMFKDCWSPKKMTEYLEIASGFTLLRESSLNITDAIQSKFRSLFTNFMIVMITRMNVKQNLDVLFGKDYCPEVEELFLSLLETIKPPKLDEVETLIGHLEQPEPLEYRPRFPFFIMVNQNIEQLIEDSRKIKNDQDNLLEEDPEEEDSTVSYPEGMDSGMSKLAQLVITAIDKYKEEEGVTSFKPLIVTKKYIEFHPEKLWDKYFSDFIYHSLHMDIITSPLSREVITTLFSDLQKLPPVQRLVYLHIYIDYNRINLANICLLLRSLEKIWMVAADCPHALDTGVSSPANNLINILREAKHPFGDPQMMTTFALSALFSALIGALLPKDKLSKGVDNRAMKMWYLTYQDFLSMPVLKSHVYLMPSLPEIEEAKFNVMHTTFAIIHTFTELNKNELNEGQKSFAILFERFFKEDLQLKEPNIAPSLADCSEVGRDLIFTSRDNQFARSKGQMFLEELFNHFLSPFKTSYSKQDIEWFLGEANQHCVMKPSSQLLNNSTSTMDISETAMYKKYLCLILKSNSNPETVAGPLLMYDTLARQKVAEVLSYGKDEQESGPYIPTFYQDSHLIELTKISENLIMQQPLCHLYFATLLEHLMSKERDINFLLRIASAISNQLLESESVPPLGEQIVLQIEKQVVIQCLLHELASSFSSGTQQRQISPILKELNELLVDDSTNGGTARGHGLTLGMHLLHMLHSHKQFIELFNSKYSLIREIQCTSIIREHLETQVESKPYLLPFMSPKDQSALGKLYQCIKDVMLNIHKTNGTREWIGKLVDLANDCTGRRSKQKDKLVKGQAFKMIIWLVTYYEFFVKKEHSQALSRVVGEQLKQYIKDEGVVKLIQGFLLPEKLNVQREQPFKLPNEDLKKRQNANVNDGEELIDPLYNLFALNRLPSQEQSGDELCHCLANLVGIVLGCQPKSNHLWYHLFAPEELKDTYMTGFMYDAKISPDSLLYDCGVELTPDGQYGHPDYLPHATRGTYSLHSLYFLLWANFGTFCVSMLTQPDTQSKIHGSIISEWQAIRHYCVFQVKTLWMHLRNNLSLSDEERSFLVTRCLMNLYEINTKSVESTMGIFKLKEQLDEYEKNWHSKVFKPALEELHVMPEDCSAVWQSEPFTSIRQLQSCYPQHPNEMDLLSYIQRIEIDNSRYMLLARFAIEKQRLEVGGQLLPSLIQLYKWLHTYLTHLVSKERANKLTIGRVIQLASRRVDSLLKELYQNVKTLYNKYMKLVGGAIGREACTDVRRGNRIYLIEDDLPLIHFLSISKDNGQGDDWLFAVIQDIAETQNHLIRTVYDIVSDLKTGESPLARILPESRNASTIYLSEVNKHSCLFGMQEVEFLWLMQARMVPPAEVDTPMKATFNLMRLQEDVVSHYFSGKPLIIEILSLRTVFRFKQESKKSSDKGLDPDPIGVTTDIMFLRDALPQEYLVPLEANDSRLLESEFHSANYHAVTDIVNGLKTAVRLLGKVLIQDQDSSSDTSVQTLKSKDLLEFVQSQYGNEKNNQHSALIHVGIKNVSKAQLKCLSSINLSNLFSTLELFVEWVKEGLYDFCSLPMALKIQLLEKDLAAIENIPARYNGFSSNLLAELKGLIEGLLHTEPTLVKEINQISQKPLMKVLDASDSVFKYNQLLKLIPDTVLVRHYVKFRVVLRRIMLNTEQKVAIETSFQDTSNQKLWSERVDDLWSNALPHLRRPNADITFVDPILLIDSKTAQYGFSSDKSEEETGNELSEDLNNDTPEEQSYKSTYWSTSNGGTGMDDISRPDISTEVSDIKTQSADNTGISEREKEDKLTSGMHVMLRGADNTGISERKKEEPLDIEQKADSWTPEMISKFLEMMGKKEHAENFLEEEIDGSMLLGADRDMYKELGVESCVEYVQIAVHFKRQLLGVDTIHSLTSEPNQGQKLTTLLSTLKKAEVDIDMLVFAQQNGLLDEILENVGITKTVEKQRLSSMLKKIT